MGCSGQEAEERKKDGERRLRIGLEWIVGMSKAEFIGQEVVKHETMLQLDIKPHACLFPDRRASMTQWTSVHLIASKISWTSKTQGLKFHRREGIANFAMKHW
jgi:hypothetical protein